MKNGRYAYRFSGYAMQKPDIQCYLVGVGIIILDGTKIKGFHRTAYTPMTDCYKVKPGYFKLKGNYRPREDGDADFPDDLEAVITFTQQKTKDASEPLQVLVGTFSLVPAGGADGFWLISTETHHKDTKASAIELVSGEAIRIPDQ